MTHIVTNPRDDEIAEFRRLAAKLGHPTMPDLHIAVKLVDKDGKVLEDRYEQGHSWTRNAWCFFHNVMMDSSDIVAASFAGNTSYSKGNWSKRDTSSNYQQTGFGYSEGSFYRNTGSLRVGTGGDSFTSEDFNLYGLIGDGSGTGQLGHLSATWTAPVLDAATNTYSRTLKRVFNNNSTASIVVREVGLIYGSYLLTRDVLSSPINVPVGAQLTISVTVTSGSWNALDATSVTLPAIGTAMGGGFYVGVPSQYSHIRYGLIVSPIAGESSPLAFRTSTTAFASNGSDENGSLNMAQLYALGAASPIGQFCANANAANLGGYNDWYIPATREMTQAMYTGRAGLTGADAFSNVDHWTSTISGTNGTGTNPRYANPTAGSTFWDPSMTSARKVRLVRRVNVA